MMLPIVTSRGGKMNFRPRKYYTEVKPKQLVAPIKVYFRDGDKLGVVEAGKAFDIEDAMKFTKEAITGDPNTKQAFLTVVQGGKNVN
jgi:hypothetical protein